MTHNHADADLRYIADHYGLVYQTDKTKEELDEMSDALENYSYFAFRAMKASVQSIEECSADLIEEMADVSIMISQMVYLLHAEDAFDREIEYKIERQIKRIKEKNSVD